MRVQPCLRTSSWRLVVSVALLVLVSGALLLGAQGCHLWLRFAAFAAARPPSQAAPLESDDPLWLERAMVSKSGSRQLAQRQGQALKQDPYHWQRMTAEAPFSRRYAHVAVVDSRQRVFVLGGVEDHNGDKTYLNDIWMSDIVKSLGQEWEGVQIRGHMGNIFSPRRGHAATMDSRGVKLFVLGGFCGFTLGQSCCEGREPPCFYSDLWFSSDKMQTWYNRSDAPWTARHGHAVAMTSKDRLVVFGGHDGGTYLNDVWAIQDPWKGTRWAQVSRTARWHQRYGHAAVINKIDKIFLLGGLFADKDSGRVECFNDVWVSMDAGESWYLVLEHAPWSGRYQHTGQISTQDDIFVAGGLNANLQRCQDMWRSADSGQTWELVSPVASWSARYEHAAVHDRKDSIYIIGGSAGDDKFNDVWRSERTCADNLVCGGDQVCRDGTDGGVFEGLPNPRCVGICERDVRLANCHAAQACRVEDGEPVCYDPCDHLKCKSHEVCNIKPRDKDHDDARAECLTCGSSLNDNNEILCNALAQCEYKKKDHLCETRCSVQQSEKACKGYNDRCQWKHDECQDKEGG